MVGFSNRICVIGTSSAGVLVSRHSVMEVITSVYTVMMPALRVGAAGMSETYADAGNGHKHRQYQQEESFHFISSPFRFGGFFISSIIIQAYP